ncbi:(d)CMP kinase [Desulforegula conservatrix]|uniref:(d)CMP kinase n=1 Tax=Desulforegula conservatrix TaxID=153026 RepID=UPI000416F425|nr:(d)CMP kinase [Desulforegula conservatrix]
MKKLLITIDGPAGAGKTTVSRSLAARLGYKYVDTGALYRAIAFEAISRNIPQDDSNALEKIFPKLDIKLKTEANGSPKILNGHKDITEFVRSPEVSMAASKISAMPAVREFLLDLQKNLGNEKEAVFEGRDMGTVVFPNADLKFFLDADIEARAMRRFGDLGGTHPLDEIREDIRTRDENDRNRAIAPLKQADDAVVVDSTNMSISEVVEFMAAEAVKMM